MGILTGYGTKKRRHVMGEVIDIATARIKKQLEERAERIKKGLKEWAELCKSYDKKDKDDE
jgi:hypothetical protein